MIHSSLLQSAVQNEKNMADDDEEENFRDVVPEDEQPLQIVPEASSWDHKSLNKSRENFTHQYDLFKRNPLYCGSDSTCLHELLLLKNHAHPTVALFAQNLLEVQTHSWLVSSVFFSVIRVNPSITTAIH